MIVLGNYLWESTNVSFKGRRKMEVSLSLLAWPKKNSLIIILFLPAPSWHLFACVPLAWEHAAKPTQHVGCGVSNKHLYLLSQSCTWNVLFSLPRSGKEAWTPAFLTAGGMTGEWGWHGARTWPWACCSLELPALFQLRHLLPPCSAPLGPSSL